MSRRRFPSTSLLVSAVLSVLLAACSSQSAPPPERAAASAGGASAQSTGERHTVIAFLGDSLTAGLGLTSSQAYPALIQQMFSAEGYNEVEVLNAGVSGDTTAGGLRRVEPLLQSDSNIRILVVALGGNDALRGLTVAQTRDNLAGILDTALSRGVAVLLAGMEGPTNLGEDYRANFRNVFTSLARDHRENITFVPFLLEGVGGVARLNQADGIHPNEQGARVVAEHVYPKLRDMVDLLPDQSAWR